MSDLSKRIAVELALKYTEGTDLANRRGDWTYPAVPMDQRVKQAVFKRIEIDGEPGLMPPSCEEVAETVAQAFELRADDVDEIFEEVWRGLTGNGSLKINVDTDVLWAYDPADEKFADARHWVKHFVNSTIRHLIKRGRLQ